MIRHRLPSFNEPNARVRRGFTLVELLMVMAAIAILMSLLFTALSATIQTARLARCQMSLRSVVFDFAVFADDTLHGDRGSDAAELGPGRFRLETFQDSQYGLDEFWRWGTAQSATLPDAAGNDPMRCPEVSGVLSLRHATPCTMGALSPPAFVSYTFNSRLHRAEDWNPRPGVLGTDVVVLRSSILSEPDVPLVWDGDGKRAAELNQVPVFSAPGLETRGLYGGDRIWFPALRHGGRMNVAFIDGRVASSANPLQERGWKWSYRPPR